MSCAAAIGTTPARLVRPTVGLMPATPALAGWAHDRTVGLGAQRDGGQRRRNRGRGTGTGTAGIAIEDIRVAALSAHAAPPARAAESAEIGPLAEVCLAEDHRASPPQARRDRRVLQRGAPRKCERACARTLAVRGVDVVLEQDRDAVQRSARALAMALADRAASAMSGRPGSARVTLERSSPLSMTRMRRR